MTNFCVLGYLPKTGVGHVESFLANLRNFPPKHWLLLYSHSHDVKGAVRLPANVEDRVVLDGKTGRASIIAINNLVFFTGVAIAASHGITHFLYIEPDCRFGEAGWDDVLWDEFREKNARAVCGGTPVVFNPCGWSLQYAERYERMLAMNARRVLPVSVTGSGRLGERFEPTLFPNGALAIYSVEWLLRAFPEIAQRQTVKLAHESKMWDMAIGHKLWKEFGESVWDNFVCLERQYSGYMDVLSSEDDRRKLLEDRRVVAVHQIKSDWKGPEKRSVPDQIPADILASASDTPPAKSPPVNTTSPAIPPNPDNFEPQVQILIVTYHKDFEFLKYCLRSIDRFAKGFAGVTVVVPKHEVRFFGRLCRKHNATLKIVDEQPETGFLNHLACKCEADLFCDAPFVLHVDADTIFKEPVVPADYFANGKPLLLCRPYASVTDPNHAQWKTRAEKAVGLSVPMDYMVTNVLCHPREVYQEVRERIQQLHKMPFRQYVMSGSPNFPYDFAEFPTIGAIASEGNRHAIVNIGTADPPPMKHMQTWSKRGIDHVIEGTDRPIRERLEEALK